MGDATLPKQQENHLIDRIASLVSKDDTGYFTFDDDEDEWLDDDDVEAILFRDDKLMNFVRA